MSLRVSAAEARKRGWVDEKDKRSQPKRGQMNGLEAAYAQQLEMEKRAGMIRGYQFEAVTLKLADRVRLTMDFYVDTPSGVELRDAKGYLRDDARIKMKVAARMFPAFRFYIVRNVGTRRVPQWDVEDVIG